MSLATGNEIIVVLAAWSIVKVVLGSWPSKLVCWTLIKKDKALVPSFPVSAVLNLERVFFSCGLLCKTRTKRKAAPRTKSEECQSLPLIAVRHLGKPRQRNGMSSSDRFGWVTSVTLSHCWRAETTLIFGNDTAISNAYLIIPIQLSCRNGFITA